MGTVKIRLMFWLSIFGLRFIISSGDRSHLVTGRYISHFDLTSLIFLLSFGEMFSYFTASSK